MKYVVVWNNDLHGSEVFFFGQIFNSKEEAEELIKRNCKYPQEFEVCEIKVANYKKGLN